MPDRKRITEPKNPVPAIASASFGLSSDQMSGPSEFDQALCARCEIANRFSSLIDAESNVIICMTPDYSILEFNRAAERLHGQKRETVLGQNYFRLFIPDGDQSPLAAEITSVLCGHASREVEDSVRPPDGTVRIMLWSVSRILDVNGRTCGMTAIGQDITERKRAGEALRRYKHIVHTSSDLLAFVSADYVYQAVNPAYGDMFARSQDQVVGKKMADVLGETLFLNQIKARLDRCMAGERVNFEAWFDLPQGSRRCLELLLNPFRNTRGVVSGVVIDGRDITEHRNSERVLVDYQRQLRAMATKLALAAQRERRRIAVGLHDQVGQALAMTKLKLGTALGSELSTDAREALEEAQAFLSQSIQATRSLTFELSSAVLRELGLQAALEQLVEWFDGKNTDTRFMFKTEELQMQAEEDRDLMIYDIARELLFNVVKYAYANCVIFALLRVGDRLQVTIEDDGVGFDTSLLAEGQSAHGGFGYFSIRERLAYLGGELEVTSSEGQGTRVVVVVPYLDR